MITVTAKLTAAEGKADALKTVLLEMLENVKANEAGAALTYSLHQADTDPNTFLFYEQYRDEEAFTVHGKSDHMRTMGRALRDQALLAGAPAIERYTQIAGL